MIESATVAAHNPADGSVIGHFPLTASAQIREIIQSAAAAQRLWQETPYTRRSACLGLVKDKLRINAENIAGIISRNTGKTIIDALATEVLPAVMAIQYYRKHGRRFVKPTKTRGGNPLLFNKPSRTIYRPWGVVGIISPWNYPFGIPFSEVVMALLAGNAVVLKVASDSLAVGQALAGLFGESGLPANLFNYVNLPGSQAGAAFLQGGVDKLFFTGSTEVGKKLMSLASETLTPLVLELGGNDAAIVCADADLRRAAAGIVWSGFSNAGQSCGGAQRILVQHGVYPAFLDILKAQVEALRAGSPADKDTDLGCLISERQKRTVADQVAQCLKMGARLFAQSPVDPQLAKANFMPAQVLVDVGPGMPIFSDEVFGPVIAVIPFGTIQEAIDLANDSAYGLTSSVWSGHRKTALQIANRIKAGAVLINDHLMSHGLAETPWGGIGDSGIGRTHGEAGFGEMLRSQVIVDETMPFIRKDIWWYPYSETVRRGLLAILTLLYDGNLLRKIRALPALLRIFLRYWEK